MIIVGFIDLSGVFIFYFYQSGYDGNVVLLLFVLFVIVDEKGLFIVDLVESWDVFDDEFIYMFYLRLDFKFSDGLLFMVDDVVFMWMILYDKFYDGGFDIFFLQVKGGKVYIEGKLDYIEGIKVIDLQIIFVILEKFNVIVLFIFGFEVLFKVYYGKDY